MTQKNRYPYKTADGSADNRFDYFGFIGCDAYRGVL